MYKANNLEIHVIDSCNLDCVGCSHESPHMPYSPVKTDKLKQCLKELKKHYHTPLIKLLGGEPLLHPKIDLIIKSVKNVTDTRLRLVTNGTLLLHRYNLLSQVNEIHISKYPNSNIPNDDKIRSIAQEINTPITIQLFTHFRWEHITSNNDEQTTQRIFNTCKIYNQWHCHTIRDGYLYPCPSTATWASKNGEKVSLLGNNKDIYQKILELLDHDVPFKACSFCLGSVGIKFEHKFGWNQTKETPPENPIDFDYLRELEENPNAYNGCYQYSRRFLPNGKIVELNGEDQ